MSKVAHNRPLVQHYDTSVNTRDTCRRGADNTLLIERTQYSVRHEKCLSYTWRAVQRVELLAVQWDDWMVVRKVVHSAAYLVVWLVASKAGQLAVDLAVCSVSSTAGQSAADLAAWLVGMLGR